MGALGAYGGTFEWVQFSEGRARFSGGVRGWDEQEHETFSVELDGSEYFGEVRKSFLPDGYGFDIEIVSFGYGDKNDVGMPRPGIASQLVPSEDVDIAGSLIVKLIQSACGSEAASFVMRQTEKSRFTGDVVFRDGWAISTRESMR